MAPPLLTLQDITLNFGGKPVFEGADLGIGPGDRVALVGRNGSGKSTLLRIAAGLIEADSGNRFVQPGATLHYLAQEPDLDGFDTTLEYVEAGLGPGQDVHRASYLLEQLGLSGQERVGHLSGGEARRAALARVLAPDPDILLLDEPTNHLDLPAIQWLETELASLRSALVIISHDRAFLSSLTRKTLWLDRGRTRQLDRGFAGFEQWRDRVLEEEETARHKLDRKIVREEHWLRYGVTARRKRNVRRLNELHRLRKARASQAGPRPDMNISVARAGETGALVLEALNISKSIGDRELIRDFSLRVMRGDRVAIIGPNGAGKTTLVNLLTGQISADSGEVRQGSNVQLALLDQTRSSLSPATSLKDALTGGGKDTVLINNVEKHVMAYMKDFLFSPEQLNTPLAALSGGERARVMLARALALPSNLLVLDEPTNDLDLETLDLLQETLADYPGTLLLVSHDRDFIDRVATVTIMAEGDGRWTAYAGGYSDMLALRGTGVESRNTPAAGRGGVGGSGKESRSKAQPARPGPERRKKLSFNQQHALKTLPAQLEKLAGEVAALQEKLAAPDFYQRDPAGFAQAGRLLEEKQREHEELETRWLELEILKEELEKG